MKKLLLILFTCLGMSTIYAQTTKVKTVLTPYNNKEHKLKLQYPKNWELTDTITDAVFYIFSPEEENDQFRENMSMNMEDITSMNIAFKDYVEENLVGIKDGTTILDFKQISGKYFVWGGKQAYEIVYTGKVKSVDFPLQWTQRFIYNKGKAYILTYSAEGGKKDPFGAAAKQIINSLKFY